MFRIWAKSNICCFLKHLPILHDLWLTNCRKSFVAKLFYRSRLTNLRHLCLIGAKVFWWVSVSWKSAERSNLRNDVARVAETLRVNVSAHWTKIIEFLQKMIIFLVSRMKSLVFYHLPISSMCFFRLWNTRTKNIINII